MGKIVFHERDIGLEPKYNERKTIPLFFFFCSFTDSNSASPFGCLVLLCFGFYGRLLALQLEASRVSPLPSTEKKYSWQPARGQDLGCRYDTSQLEACMHAR